MNRVLLTPPHKTLLKPTLGSKPTNCILALARPQFATTPPEETTMPGIVTQKRKACSPQPGTLQGFPLRQQQISSPLDPRHSASSERI